MSLVVPRSQKKESDRYRERDTHTERLTETQRDKQRQTQIFQVLNALHERQIYIYI